MHFDFSIFWAFLFIGTNQAKGQQFYLNLPQNGHSIQYQNFEVEVKSVKDLFVQAKKL